MNFSEVTMDIGNPEGIVCGDLGDKTSYNENSCGALSCKITLKVR
jgi:chitobiose phosphorylase (EC 2.4.1.-)